MTQLGFLEAPPRVDPRPVNTSPWKQYDGVTLYHGDCLDILRAMPANSVDAGVTDPPYGIGFMGQEWDTFSPEVIQSRARKAFQVGAGRMRNHENPNIRGRSHSPALSPSQIGYDYTLEGLRSFQRWTAAWALELIRVLKPGAHVVVCGAPRAAHRMYCGLEDAGFEIRDSLPWLFGQGFPKSLDVARAIDMELCAQSGRHFMRALPEKSKRKPGDHVCEETPEGLAWLGCGTGLKPGHEPIALARKPFDGTIERNLRLWGTGALNIKGCRVETAGAGDRDPRDGLSDDIGRWPPNIALDAQAASRLDAQAGIRKSGANPTRRGSDKFRRIFRSFPGEEVCTPARGAEEGGASRFFFVAKPSRAERDFGCDDLPMLSPGECTEREEGSAGITPYAGAGRSGGGRNFHPTVKPVALMRWLIRLITPPGGVVLDNFLGSGTTGMAALLEGRPFIGIDREPKYLTLSDARISAVWRELREPARALPTADQERFVCGDKR